MKKYSVSWFVTGSVNGKNRHGSIADRQTFPRSEEAIEYGEFMGDLINAKVFFIQIWEDNYKVRENAYELINKKWTYKPNYWL